MFSYAYRRKSRLVERGVGCLALWASLYGLYEFRGHQSRYLKILFTISNLHLRFQNTNEPVHHKLGKNQKVKTLYDYALTKVNTPYKWGGSNPISGYDCSGLVQELLASVGIDPPGDQTAQGLFDYFKNESGWNVYGLGSIAFFGKDAAHITHVAMMLDNYRIIEAGGGGSATRTLDDADHENAVVRIRHITNRKDLIAVIRPSYAKIGMMK